MPLYAIWCRKWSAFSALLLFANRQLLNPSCLRSLVQDVPEFRCRRGFAWSSRSHPFRSRPAATCPWHLYLAAHRLCNCWDRLTLAWVLASASRRRQFGFNVAYYEMGALRTTQIALLFHYREDAATSVSITGCSACWICKYAVRSGFGAFASSTRSDPTTCPSSLQDPAALIRRRQHFPHFISAKLC